LMPLSQAALRIGNACSSSRIHGCQWVKVVIFEFRQTFDETKAYSPIRGSITHGSYLMQNAVIGES
jgi:hypothetical protein